MTQYVFIKAQYVGAVLEGEVCIGAVKPGHHFFNMLGVLQILDRAQNHTPCEFLVALDAF